MCVCSFFSDNQYPGEAKREEIAAACNAVVQKPGGTPPVESGLNKVWIYRAKANLCVCVPGKTLSDLERVTSLKVYNWFANRRKDIKRRANIGKVYLRAAGSVENPGSSRDSGRLLRL